MLGLLGCLIASCGGNTVDADIKDSTAQINPAPIHQDSLVIVDTGIVQPITPIR
jgi:hypothetical protein